MKKSIFNVMELSGILLCMISVIFLRNLYYTLGGAATGVLFGSVNSSIWEQLKPIILSYILYGLAELMCARPYFRQFTVSKAVGLYLSVAVFLVMSRLLPADFIPVITLSALAAGFLLSRYLTLFGKSLSGLFILACLMLLLIFVMYFSFSAFPPRLDIFLDKESGMYGIIPDYIDIGAEMMNKFS